MNKYLLIILLSSFSFATTIHVATTGSDDTGDGSEQNPVATIEKASQLVSIFYDENYTNPLLDYTGQSTTDTIMVHDGTYYLGNLCSGDEYNTIVNIITSMNGPLSTSLLPINQYSGIGCTEAYYDISGFTISGLELFYYSSWLYFENCVITETSRIDGSSCGLSNNSCFGFQNTTFVNNNNWSNYDFNGAPYFINSIIFDNDNFLFEVINNDTSAISFTLNDMGLNSNGNFSDTDPLFCNPDNGDYSLAANSPAVGAGENGSNMGALGVGCEAINLSIGKDILPLQYALYHNYPNPFNPVTKLRYDLLEDSYVRVTVYDMLGNVVNNLVNDNQNSGYKSVQWDATNNQGQQVSAGVYLYSIEAGDFRQTKKMILLK